MEKPKSCQGQLTISMTTQNKLKNILGENETLYGHIALGHEMIHAVNNKAEKVTLSNIHAFEMQINQLSSPEHIRHTASASTEKNFDNTAYTTDLILIMTLIARLEEFATVGLAGDNNYDITEYMLCKEANIKIRKTYDGLTPENTIPEIKERMKKFRNFLNKNPIFISNDQTYSSLKPENTPTKVQRHMDEVQKFFEYIQSLISNRYYKYQLTEQGKDKLAEAYKIAQKTCKEYGVDIPDIDADSQSHS